MDFRVNNTVAVDLAKSVFHVMVADGHWRVVEHHRLARAQFERFFVHPSVGLVVMEVCGSAHYWARRIIDLGIEVRLLPARYIRASVKRNKTDAADVDSDWRRSVADSMSARDTQFPLQMPATLISMATASVSCSQPKDHHRYLQGDSIYGGLGIASEILDFR